MKKYFVDKIDIEKVNGTCILIDTSINTVKNESFAYSGRYSPSFSGDIRSLDLKFITWRS